MEKLSLKEIRKLFERNSILPVHERKIGVLPLSCWANVGTKEIREIIPVFYPVIVGLGKKGVVTTIINEEKMMKKASKFIENNMENLDKLTFSVADDMYQEVKYRFDNEIFDEEISLKEKLELIVELYSKYMISMVIYNIFWSYIGESFEGTIFDEEDCSRIAKSRDIVAKLYHEIENSLAEMFEIIGKKKGFDGDLLKYLTSSELKEYIQGNFEMSKEFLNLLLKRQQGFLYINDSGVESILVDKEILSEIESQYLNIENSAVSQIKGFMVYDIPQRIIGKVYNAKNHLLEKHQEIEKGDILVTSMTTPNQIVYLDKVQAIVTDEGGILCHAAVVARELKIPCVVGTKTASRLLNDGDIIEIETDGSITISKRFNDK